MKIHIIIKDGQKYLVLDPKDQSKRYRFLGLKLDTSSLALEDYIQMKFKFHLGIDKPKGELIPVNYDRHSALNEAKEKEVIFFSETSTKDWKLTKEALPSQYFNLKTVEIKELNKNQKELISLT